MAEFKTPTKVSCKNQVTDNTGLNTPIKIPPSPLLQKVAGTGTGVIVYMVERSPKVGFARSPWAVKKWINGRNNETNNRRLRLEADVLRQLNHPNIVGFRAFTTGTDGKPCLAMEIVDISLGDKIEERQELMEDVPFPAKDILKVGYDVAKGLKYLHNTAHILHGDIKSWNILVSHDFKTVKLCDFGASLPLTESLEVDTSKGDFSYGGTLCWNAPEVILEEEPVTSAADIWAYGLVLWEMIALSIPHAEELEDGSFVDLIAEINAASEQLDDSNADMNESMPQEDRAHICSKYGTRPSLPAIDLSKEYENIIEVFFVCTNQNFRIRPSAKMLVNYFEQHANIDKK